MILSLLEIWAIRYTVGDQQSANFWLKYAGFQMPEIHFLSNPFSDPNFKDIKKLEIAIL